MAKLMLIALLLWQQPSAPPSGVLSGTLLYSDGTPATAQVVRFTPLTDGGAPPQGRVPIAMTDTSGNYSGRVPPGRYFIQTTGANVVFYPGVLSQSSATAVVVTAGSTSSDLNFSLPLSASGVRVQGHVTVPPDYPVPASTLEVRLARTSLSTRRLAEDGTFEFTHVMPGSYPLTVSARGLQPSIITVADRDVTGLEISAPPLTRLQGTVSLEGGGTRPQVSVQIEGLLPPGASPQTSPSGPFKMTATPAADGTFSEVAPPGEYRIAINNIPAGYYLKAIASGAKDLIGNSLKITPADTPIRVAVTLGISSGVRLAGRVRPADAEDSATVPEKIVFSGVAVDESTESALNSDGFFEFAKMLPGTYDARVVLTPTVSSPPTRIIVPNRNVTDLEIPVPGTREISGKVAVDGNGVPPKFTLLLVRGGNSVVVAGPPGELPSVSAATLANLALGGGIAGAQVLQVDVNALPDGSFRLRVPDGDYRVVATPAGLISNSGGIPAAYFVRSVTANSIDLMTEPLHVSDKETPEIHVGFGTTSPNPWVRVSGRVKGLDASRAALRVTLESNVTSAIETYVDAEGKFEFPVVLQRTRYTARLLPADDASSTPRISVEDKDVTGVEIVSAAKREITARISVEGNYPAPSVALTLDATDSSMTVLISPESDGSARIKLPEDERKLRQFSGLPLGYAVKSITYGSTDLRKQPLRLAGSAEAELKITLTVDPAIPSGSIRGRVVGLDLENGPVRLVLGGVTAFGSFEASVNADGSFVISKLPQGTYIPTLEGAVKASSLTPGSIVVHGTELAGIEIVASPVAAPKSARAEEAPKGALVSDFPGNSRASANESAAVANLRTINTALVVFLSGNGGRYGNMQDLVGAGLLDSTFNSAKSGFNYSLIAIGSEYAAAAIPVSPAAGRYGFYSTADAVVRYSTFEPLAPTQQSGKPVQ